MRRAVLVLLCLSVAVLLAGCGGGQTAPSTRTTVSLTGKLEPNEYRLAQALLRTPPLKDSAARNRLCSEIATKYGPLTPITQAVQDQCAAVKATVAPARGYARCVGKIPKRISQTAANKIALECNVHWFPAMATGEGLFSTSVPAIDAALRQRGISPSSRCGEIFALGPGLAFAATHLRADEEKVVAIAARVLRSPRLITEDVTPQFLAADDAFGADEKRLQSAIVISDGFPISVCRRAASS